LIMSQRLIGEANEIGIRKLRLRDKIVHVAVDGGVDDHLAQVCCSSARADRRTRGALRKVPTFMERWLIHEGQNAPLRCRSAGRLVCLRTELDYSRPGLRMLILTPCWAPPHAWDGERVSLASVMGLSFGPRIHETIGKARRPSCAHRLNPRHVGRSHAAGRRQWPVGTIPLNRLPWALMRLDQCVPRPECIRRHALKLVVHGLSAVLPALERCDPTAEENSECMRVHSAG
jgi:hypothetical protein